MTYATEPMFVPEGIIERDIERAVKASRRADASIWVAGFYVHRVWRVYQVDATAHIANECGRDKSTIENWAHAYDLYTRLRRLFRTEARKLRKGLTPSHFWTAWELQRKYNLTDQNVLWELDQMLNYKKTGEAYGASALRSEVEASSKRNGNSPTWEYYLPRFRTLYTDWMAAEGTPKPVIEWLHAAPKEVTG